MNRRLMNRNSMNRIPMNRRGFLTAAAGLLALSLEPRELVGQGAPSGPGSVTPRSGKDPTVTAVTVDPRIELYYVVLALSDFRGPPGAPAPVMTDLDFPYRAAVRERFGPFQDHPAVGRYGEMARKGFWMGHPVSTMLHLSPPPALVEEIPVNEFTVKMAGGRPAMDAFLEDMCRFARDSGFGEWFRERRPFFRRMTAGCRGRMERDYVADLVEYFGEARDGYTLILAPLAHPGGFGPRVRLKSGRYAAFAVIGPKGLEADVPTFGSPEQKRRLLWHEFSHAHVNHLTDRHLDQLMAPVTVLQGHTRAEVERYVPWEVHVADWVSEHVVRAVTTRLAHREMGPGEGDAALEKEARRFPHVGLLARRLEAYESDRERYPTLAAFFPELVEVFRKVAT